MIKFSDNMSRDFLYVKQMKSCSSSASLAQFLDINDELSDDDISLEQCADKQAAILHQGKRIEEFINNWDQTHPKDTCFRLLCILFNLFKSEVTANLSLREALMTYRSNVKLSEDYERQLTKLFSAVKRYDPNIQSLTEILSLLKRKVSLQVPEDLSSQIAEAKSKLKIISDDAEEKKSIFEKITKKLDDVQSTGQKQIDEKRQLLETAKAEENRLRNLLKNYQQENAALTEKQNQLQYEEDPQKLKETIEFIDGKMGELQSKVSFVNKKHHQKITQLRSKVNQYQISVNDLRNDKAAIEGELDRIHQEIDAMTNPLTQCKDESKSPHYARIRLNEIKTEFTQAQKKHQAEMEEIKLLEQNIDALETKLTSLNKKMQRGKDELESLETEYESKEKILTEMNEKRKAMKEIATRKHEIDEVKRHADAENLRLKQELETAKARSRQCAIDNNLLLKTIENLKLKKSEFLQIHHDSTLNENEINQFDGVLNAFRTIRESLSLSSESTPMQITDAVLTQVS
ncbi:hypothetical protein TRFO_15778 [Tritrichomonas foetus]|uniref:Uncharacterized protein n=1 Tax=Tritrichomonas foetus TaxID=1144522 RepID=A0A1J4KWI8_9EUKA|nr:hypothetical protein TRFO_15778 [Tritrichomonas foetus]|eukprot:OHT13901.1 hypothetical protein TRFO_15778 [Tritrichomonas foetus]